MPPVLSGAAVRLVKPITPTGVGGEVIVAAPTNLRFWLRLTKSIFPDITTSLPKRSTVVNPFTPFHSLIWFSVRFRKAEEFDPNIERTLCVFEFWTNLGTVIPLTRPLRA